MSNSQALVEDVPLKKPLACLYAGKFLLLQTMWLPNGQLTSWPIRENFLSCILFLKMRKVRQLCLGRYAGWFRGKGRYFGGNSFVHYKKIIQVSVWFWSVWIWNLNQLYFCLWGWI